MKNYKVVIIVFRNETIISSLDSVVKTMIVKRASIPYIWCNFVANVLVTMDMIDIM